MKGSNLTTVQQKKNIFFQNTVNEMVDINLRVFV